MSLDAEPAELPCGLNSREQAQNYFDWMARLFGGELTGNVLDHGAGTGALTARLAQSRSVKQVWALEPDGTLAQLLQARFGGEPRVRVLHGIIETYRERHGDGTLDAVVSSNVLEHLADDVGCLRQIRQALRARGALAVYVPARQELFGSLDSAVGHLRRYSRTSLRSALEQAGFRVEWVAYRNLLGVAPWVVSGKLLRKVAIADGDMRFFDRLLFPAWQQLESLLPRRLPYGLNVAALARSP